MTSLRQPGGVGGHEQNAMLASARGLEETNEFFPAIDLRQLAGVLAAHAQVEIGLAENLPVQEGDRRRLQIAGALGQSAFH